jgi:type VI protein secretion system component Hcp
VKTDPKGAEATWQTVTLTNARVVDLERATMQLDDAAKTSMLADTISFVYQKLELHDQGGKDTIIEPNAAL